METAIPGICSDTCSPRPIFSTGPISRWCIPRLPLHYPPHTHCAASQTEYSTVLNCLPSYPQPPNFCQLCPSLHCRAQAGHPNQGLEPLLFSRHHPFTQPKTCQADKKPPLIKRGSKLSRSFFAHKCQRYIWPFSPHLHEFVSPFKKGVPEPFVSIWVCGPHYEILLFLWIYFTTGLVAGGAPQTHI